MNGNHPNDNAGNVPIAHGVLFAFDGDDVVWTQRFDRLVVYLDTFAIRAIADNDERSTRFAQALQACNGT